MLIKAVLHPIHSALAYCVRQRIRSSKNAFVKGRFRQRMRSSKNAFIKERVHNAVEIDILGIFGHVFIVTNLAPLKYYSGAVASLSFYRPRFNAYTHVETENSSIVQIERSWMNMRSSSYSTSGENKTIDENDNPVRIQTESRLYVRTGLSCKKWLM